MDVGDWRRRAGNVIDVGKLPSFSLRGRGSLVAQDRPGPAGRRSVLFSTYYQVNADEVGVVQRFGRYVRTTDPGPHLKIPFIETVTRVPVQRQLKAEFGFRTTVAGVQSEFEQNDDDAGRVADADRRPQRRRRRVDRPVQGEGPVQVPVQGPQPRQRHAARRRRHVPRHERGGDARGRRRPQRQRGADGRPREDPGRREGRCCSSCATATRPASRCSRSCCRT